MRHFFQAVNLELSFISSGIHSALMANNTLSCQWTLFLSTGFIWGEIKEMWDGGFNEYVHDWWNLMDFAMNSLYLATISLKIVAYVKVNISGAIICNLLLRTVVHRVVTVKIKENSCFSSLWICLESDQPSHPDSLIKTEVDCLGIE